MANALDALRAGSESAETPAPAPGTGSPNPLDALRHAAPSAAPPSVLGQVGHVAGQVATGVGNALDAQRFGLAKLLTGKDTTDDQRTAERQAVGTQGVYDALGKVPVVGHFLQGASDVVQDTLTDPLTYETLGAGPVLKALGLADKAAVAATRVGKAVTDTPLGAAVHDFGTWGGPVARARGVGFVDTLRGTANMAGAEGANVQRKLMEDFEKIHGSLSDAERIRVGKALNGEQLAEGGAIGRAALTPKEQDAYDGLRSLTEQDLAHRTKTAQVIAFNEASRGLSEEDAGLLKRALDANTAPEIPAPGKRITVPGEGASVGQRTREINKNVALNEDLGQPRSTVADLPSPHAPSTRPLENQAEIDRMTHLQGLYHDIQAKVEQNVPKREDYFPTAHEGEPIGEHVPEKTVSEKDYYDPRTKERDDIHVTDAAQMRAGFEAMAKNTGRQVKTRIVNEQLGHLLDDPEIDKLFSRTIAATGDARTNTAKVKDAWLKFIGYPRAATVSLTPRHGVNIMDLAANTVPAHLLPQYTRDVTALTAKLLRAKSEDEYQALTKEGTELGALGGDFRERAAFFQNVPGLNKWAAANNKLVWAIDTAAKQEYAKILVKTGEARGLQAGGLASKRLVDYTHVSPLVKALRYVAPFGTFRGSVPGAVLGGIARNPARAALLNRATQGTMYGGKPGPGQHGATFYGPTSDVARGLDAPQDFVRGTIGAPVTAAGVLGTEALTGNPGASLDTMRQELADLPGQIMRGEFSKIGTPGKVSPYAKAVALRTARYLNYRNPIDWRWLVDQAAAGLPEAQAVVEQVGGSQFAPPQGNPAQRLGGEALRQSTGIGFR
jgi:hypothetical protein